jgi:hypothetical protein
MKVEERMPKNLELLFQEFDLKFLLAKIALIATLCNYVV